jgi:hypothetical protein
MIRKILVLLLSLIPGWAINSEAQPVPLGEVIFISNSEIKKDVRPESLKEFFSGKEVASMGRKTPGSFIKLYQADRGEKNGRFLLTLSVINKQMREKSVSPGSPFTDDKFRADGALKSMPSEFLANPESYTEYELIGAGRMGLLLPFELLGIHYLSIRQEKTEDFENFILEELNPRVNRLLPDMGLFYYKAVAGDNLGSYITVFAIRSVEAREKYWPADKPETEELKAAFKPLNELARKLGTYLETDSYLKPDSGGGAAYFESLNWTDYVLVMDRGIGREGQK